MKKRFEQIVVATKQRRRRLNALWAGGWALLISVSLTLIYVLGAAFNLFPRADWLWLVMANLLAGGIGWAYGSRKFINLRESLYQIDRTLNLGEKLTTLHELKTEKADSGFLPLLEERVERLSIDPYRVFSLSNQDKQRWLAVSIGIVGCLAIGLLLRDIALYGPGLTVQTRQANEAKSEIKYKDLEQQKVSTLPNELKPTPEAVAAKVNALKQRMQEVLKNPQLGERERQQELAKLAQEAQDLENALWGNGGNSSQSGTGSQGPNDAGSSAPGSNQLVAGKKPGSGTSKDAAGEDRARNRSMSNQKREQAEQQKRDLEELKDQLLNEQLTIKELREILRNRQNSGDPEVEKALEEAEQAEDSQSAAQAIARAIENINKKQAADQQLKDVQNQLSRGDGAPAEDESGEGQETDQSNASEPGKGRNSNEEGPNLRGVPPGNSKGNPSGSGQDPDAQAEEGQNQNAGQSPKGTSTGNGAGGNPLGEESKLDQLPDASTIIDLRNEAQIPDLDILMSFMTQGVPLENARVTEGARPVLQINFSKVDTALDLLGVPPEMREEILGYFLSLSTSTAKKPSK